MTFQKPSNVVISIYDILGNEVIELVNEEQHYGYKKIMGWRKSSWRQGRLVFIFTRQSLGSLLKRKR